MEIRHGQVGFEFKANIKVINNFPRLCPPNRCGVPYLLRVDVLTIRIGRVKSIHDRRVNFANHVIREGNLIARFTIGFLRQR